MKISEKPSRDHSFEETFSFLDRAGQSKVLCCLEEIAEAFSLDKNAHITTDVVASSLISLEKNIGHNSVPPLLTSIGIAVEESTLSLTGSMKDIGEALARMKDIISRTPNAKPQPTFTMPSCTRSTERIFRSLGVRRPNIDNLLPPSN